MVRSPRSPSFARRRVCGGSQTQDGLGPAKQNNAPCSSAREGRGSPVAFSEGRRTARHSGYRLDELILGCINVIKYFGCSTVKAALFSAYR